MQIVLGEGLQDVCLAIEQATLGMLGSGPSGLEINAVESKLGFQLFNLRSRSGRRRWRRSFHVHHGGGRGRERRIAIIVHIAGHGDTPWLRSLCTQCGGGTSTGDLARSGSVTVYQSTAIGTAGVRSDG